MNKKLMLQSMGRGLVIGAALHDSRQSVHLIVGCKENFAFAELDMLLQIVSHRLGNTIVVHGIGNGNTHLLAECKEMVDTVFGIENNSRIIQNIDSLCAKLFRSKHLRAD